MLHRRNVKFLFDIFMPDWSRIPTRRQIDWPLEFLKW